jgi:PAS domain S-box-containing protein
MWNIPQEVLSTKDDDKAIAFVLDQLKEPEKFIAKVKELYNKPEAESFDLLEFKDGRFFERYSMPERRNNKPVGRVWNFIDITRTKHVEAGLKASEEKYRKIVEEVADVVYSVDAKGYFTYMNPVCRKLSGYHESDLIGKHFSGLVAPDWRVRVMKFYMNQFRNRVQESVYSFPIVTSTGKLLWVEQTVSQLRDGEHVVGYQAVCRDISERMAMQEKLESSNKDLENFAYIASHDLQEPLRMVTSFLGLLEQRLSGKLEGESKEFFAYAVNGAKRMKEMINDLLSYSRIINKKAEFRQIELKEMLDDLVFELKEIAKEAHATIILPDKMPTLVADEIKLKRLFQNLLTNALKFSRKGVDPVIKISCAEQPDAWSFSISDNGIGIRKEHFNKLFIIFKRLHAKDEYPGTGIGLAECKKIAEMHKGRIWVESEEEKGSTFSFTVNKALEVTPAVLSNAA